MIKFRSLFYSFSTIAVFLLLFPTLFFFPFFLSFFRFFLSFLSFVSCFLFFLSFLPFFLSFLPHPNIASNTIITFFYRITPAMYKRMLGDDRPSPSAWLKYSDKDGGPRYKGGNQVRRETLIFRASLSLVP